MADTNTARDIVVKFYEAALNEKNPEKARAFLGDNYIQHNPMFPTASRAFCASSVSAAKNIPAREMRSNG
jgi:predicted SnoaL-like aldol condensation-catalyzing enzyme